MNQRGEEGERTESTPGRGNRVSERETGGNVAHGGSSCRRWSWGAEPGPSRAWGSLEFGAKENDERIFKQEKDMTKRPWL